MRAAVVAAVATSLVFGPVSYLHAEGGLLGGDALKIDMPADFRAGGPVSWARCDVSGETFACLTLDDTKRMMSLYILYGEAWDLLKLERHRTHLLGVDRARMREHIERSVVQDRNASTRLMSMAQTLDACASACLEPADRGLSFWAAATFTTSGVAIGVLLSWLATQGE